MGRGKGIPVRTTAAGYHPSPRVPCNGIHCDYHSVRFGEYKLEHRDKYGEGKDRGVINNEHGQTGHRKAEDKRREETQGKTTQYKGETRDTRQRQKDKARKRETRISIISLVVFCLIFDDVLSLPMLHFCLSFSIASFFAV
jgi:hypothetical protein